MSNHNPNDNTNTTRTQGYLRAIAREQRRAHRRIFEKVEEDMMSRITEEDLRKILSAPMEKRNSRNSYVNDPEIIWEYVPREQDGLTIELGTASSILGGITERALRERLNESPGYAWVSQIRQPDGICRHVVCYYRGQGFSLPDFLKDLPFVTTEEKIWQPSGFKLESAPPIQPGSKLYPKSDFSLTLSEEFNGGTVGFIGTLDRGTDVTKAHVLVTVGHVLDGKDASTCGIEMNINDPTQVVQLHPVDEFRRELDDNAKRRPRFQKGRPYNPCLDEICLISTNGLPNHLLLNCQFQLPIDCNLFFTDIPKQDTNTTHYPGVLANVEDVIEMLREFTPLTVCKNGAKTGLTTGTLWEFRPYSECNPIDTTAFSKANDFNCMVIKWKRPSELDRFSDDGDSGSLVYAIHDGHMVVEIN